MLNKYTVGRHDLPTCGGLGKKKIDYLFSVERPLFKEMCAFTFFIGNMPHIVFLFRKVRKMNLKLLNNSKESGNHALF